jgi:hypothetical protein
VTDDFRFVADATRFPADVTNVSRVSVPARSLNSPANLYVRIAGIANFDVDPAVPDTAWQRGSLAVVLPALAAGDTCLEVAGTTVFRVIVREEETESDDFAIAIDELGIPTVNPAGELALTIKLAFMGDVWVRRLGFAVNLLVHRPSLDEIAPGPPRFTLDDFLRDAVMRINALTRG